MTISSTLYTKTIYKTKCCFFSSENRKRLVEVFPQLFLFTTIILFLFEKKIQEKDFWLYFEFTIFDLLLPRKFVLGILCKYIYFLFRISICCIICPG